MKLASGRSFPKRALIGMVHLRALPSSPAASSARDAVQRMVEQALHEANMLVSTGFVRSLLGGPRPRARRRFASSDLTQMLRRVRRTAC